MRSRDGLNKYRRLYMQCVSQADDVNQAHVAFPSFYAPNVVAVQAGKLSQAFLGQTTLDPQFADAFAKKHAWV
jgi:hypothetical protein